MNGRSMAAVAALLAVAAAELACQRGVEAQPPSPPAVLISEVRSSPSPLTLPAAVAPRARLRLGFRDSGIVRQVLVRAGDTVHRGELVAELDSSTADARLEGAKLALGKAEKDWSRTEALVRTGSLAAAAADDTWAAVVAARASLVVAEDSARSTRLLSPVDGTVFERSAEPGEAISADVPVVVVDDTTRLVVRLGVTREDLRRVRGSPRVAILDRDQNAVCDATVSSLTDNSNASTGLYDVELAPVGDTTDGLRAGDLVEARFDPQPGEAALRVPIEAVVQSHGADAVFVVDPEAAAPVVHLRPIQIDRPDRDTILIRAGVSEGDRIVAEGASFLRDGDPVRLVR